MNIVVYANKLTAGSAGRQPGYEVSPDRDATLARGAPRYGVNKITGITINAFPPLIFLPEPS